ncbi:DUF397 domain-containing protein [Frankia sp. AgB1.9]|nr:DUF397 domain-containing protein [Frankia sp. AgW1.1]MBL7546710.1 DUF397 domain-containing protein [Frankia sp. AgB1.9]
MARGDLVLALSPAEWHAFLDGVRAGQFDRPAPEPAAPDAPAPATWREAGGPTWQVSSFGQGLRGTPLLVALPQTATPGVCLRDVIDPGGPTLTLPPAAWHAFLQGARAGEFDHPPPHDAERNGRDTPATGDSRPSCADDAESFRGEHP